MSRLFRGDFGFAVHYPIYFDNAATTRVHPDVVEAMRPYFTEFYANPSSPHPQGNVARAAIENARETVASALGCAPGEIVFTSGGTEADNLGLIGAALANQAKGKHIITSAIEHQAILAAVEFLETLGFEVTRLPVDSTCRIRLDDLSAALRPDTSIVSVMLANNETGSIQPIEEVATLLKSTGTLLHTDAVQAFGKIPFNVGSLGVDLLSISAHKIHGPKGVGALYVRRGVRLQRLMHGGFQENGRRAGTENVPGIVGMAKAVERASSWTSGELAQVAKLRDFLEAEIPKRIPTVRVNGGRDHRVPTISNLCFPHIDHNYLHNRLRAAGICATAGSACASSHQEPSHVLSAMGLSSFDAQGSVRFSLSMETTKADVEEAVARILDMFQVYEFKAVTSKSVKSSKPCASAITE